MSTETKTEAELRDVLRHRVYYAARDGMAITLYALLADKRPEETDELLTYVIEDEGQKCSCLLIAARNGHDKCVRMLLSKFKPQIEQEGTVKFDGYVIEGASALWCAAGAGHINVVKTLLKYGANVNHPTRTNSTPLRAACFDGRLDIVQYLIENDADLHIANKYNNTCLMIAAYKGYLDVVSHLLKKGADPDVKANCGATALHFAAECGHLQIVKELLDHKASMTANEHRMTPVIAAAERTRASVVEYLIERCRDAERIEALELLGASYANDKDSYSIDKAFIYLERAMEDREKLNIRKPPQALRPPPLAAYDRRMECETLDELRAIRNNTDALHMEALVVRERILGARNPEVPHPVIFRGAVFADCARFDRCIALWLHALSLRQDNRLSVAKDLLRFAQVFSQMIHIGVELPLSCVMDVTEVAARELDRNLAKIVSLTASSCAAADGSSKSVDDEPLEAAKEEADGNVHTVLYLLIILTKLIRKASEMHDEQEQRIYRAVYHLNRLDVRTKRGRSLLHLAVDSTTLVDDFHTSDVCRLPCTATAKLLIHCGAEVNAVDSVGDTPLHLIVGYQNPISDFLTLHSIIMALIEGGAHMDTVNHKSNTPFEAATSGVAEIILRTQSKLSLKCMAAKAVKKFNLSYQGQVPQSLETFIELHGVPMGYD